MSKSDCLNQVSMAGARSAPVRQLAGGLQSAQSAHKGTSVSALPQVEHWAQVL